MDYSKIKDLGLKFKCHEIKNLLGFVYEETSGFRGLWGHFKPQASSMGSSISASALSSWGVPVLKACHCVSLAVGNPPWEAHPHCVRKKTKNRSLPKRAKKLLGAGRSSVRAVHQNEAVSGLGGCHLTQLTMVPTTAGQRQGRRPAQERP